jgi:hypothetical protein
MGIEITFRREGRAGNRIIMIRRTLENTVSTVSSVSSISSISSIEDNGLRLPPAAPASLATPLNSS